MPTDLRLGSKTEPMLTDLNDRLQIWTLQTKQTKQPSIQNKYRCMGSQIKKNTPRFHWLWIIGKELCLPFYDRNIFSIEHSCWFGCTCFKQKVKVYIHWYSQHKKKTPSPWSLNSKDQASEKWLTDYQYDWPIRVLYDGTYFFNAPPNGTPTLETRSVPRDE